jgi:hypothetical protein
MTGRIAAVVAAIITIALPAYSQSRSGTYSSQVCGIRFHVPAGWTVQTTKQSKQPPEICALVIRPANIAALIEQDDHVDLYSITINVLKAELDHAAAKAFFERREARWVVVGRTGIEADAVEISSARWVGVKGLATVGCYRDGDEGGYVGLCENPRAALNNRREVSAIISGAPQSGDAVEAILKSFEFIH